MTLANRVTILRMLLIPVYAVLMYMPVNPWWPAAAFILVAVTDFLDGYLARSRGEITSFGKLMDPIADKMMVMTAFIILVEQGKLHAVLCVVFIAREFIMSGFRLLLAASPGRTVLAAGWLGKIKTVTQIVAVVLLMVNNRPFSLVGFPMDTIVVWVSLFFAMWSMVDYIYKNRQVVNVRGDKA